MFDFESSKYFISLPEESKQKIRESGRKFYSESDLREYVTGTEGTAR